MARDIFVVAHAQSVHHIQGLGGGWYDTPLTALGHRQARCVAERIAELADDSRPLEIYASDLLRAAQTADAIGRRLASPVAHRPDLRERNFGEAGGKPTAWADARRVAPPRDVTRLDHRDGIAGVESMREILTRIYRGMDQVLESGCRTQVVVTHGFALSCVIAAWIRMPLEAAAWVNFKSNPGGITHLGEDDAYFNRAVVRLNDTAHLASE